MKIVYNSPNKLLYFILLTVLFLRGVTLEVAELVDPTETRYATIAANMLTNNDYVIPRLYEGNSLDTYFSKPPLHFWLTSIAFKFFGIDEWTARLASFLSLIAICFCLVIIGKKLWNDNTGIISAIFCASSPLIFLMSGGSHVDMTFTACVTIALSAFILRVHNSSSFKMNEIYSAIFFIATALSFLTKGPVGLVLILLPIALWILCTKSYSVFKLPSWKFGIILFLVITIPWFYLAEKASPGFLEYYFINENLLRYITHDYGGRHGANHTRVYGYIWFMLLLATAPFSFFGITFLIKGKASLIISKLKSNKLIIFFLLWGVSPAIFFTFSSSILSAYVLPGIPGLAICFALLIKDADYKFIKKSSVIKQFSVTEIIASLLIFGLIITGFYLKNEFFITFFVLLLSISLFILFKYLKIDSYQIGALRMSLALSVLYVIVTLTFADVLGDSKSSNGILTYIANVSENKIPKIALLETGNQSPMWTSLAWKNELNKQIVVKPMSVKDVINSDIENIVRRTKHEKYLPKKLTSLFTEKENIGNWSWYVRNKE